MQNNIAILPTSFEIDRNEASNITTKLLAEKFAKLYNTYIFTGNIRKKKKKEIYKNIQIIRYSKISGFPKSFRPLKYLNATLTHLTASFLSYYKFQKKNDLKLDLVIGFSASNLLVIRTLLFKLFNKNTKTIHVFKSKSDFGNYTYKWLLNKLDLIIVQNKSLKYELKQKGIKTKITLINSPINTLKFKSLKNKKELKQKYGLQNKQIILYYGHFNRFKGVEYLIEAFKLVKNKTINLILIPSDNSHKNKYQDLLVNHIFKHRIKILSAKTPIIEVLSIADVVVLPYPQLTSTESNPSCIIESLSCKTPVITSKLKELKLVFQNNILYALPKNPLDISNQINKLLKNKDLQKELKHKGYILSKQFDINKISQKYITLIDKLINEAKF
ncbi:MAG: glycosyltransferase [Nanoarchaeota archaeon]|nr:glycosyltransferase [Nanoarchaeota archaeon]